MTIVFQVGLKANSLDLSFGLQGVHFYFSIFARYEYTTP